MKIAVSLHRDGLACTASTIFFVKPSNRSSLEEAGWPSTSPLGLTKETAGKRSVLDVVVEIGRVLDVRGADSGIGHDRGVVLEWIADVAVFVGIRADGPIVQLIGVGHIVIPLIAVIFPGDIGGDQLIANAAHRRGRNCEHGVVRIRVGKRVVAVAEVAGVVVIQQIVVAGFAVGIDRLRQRLEVIHDWTRRQAEYVRAIGVGAAAIGSGTEGTAAVTIFRSTSYSCRRPDSDFRLHPPCLHWPFPPPLQRCAAELQRCRCHR